MGVVNRTADVGSRVLDCAMAAGWMGKARVRDGDANFFYA